MLTAFLASSLSPHGIEVALVAIAGISLSCQTQRRKVTFAPKAALRWGYPASTEHHPSSETGTNDSKVQMNGGRMQKNGIGKAKVCVNAGQPMERTSTTAAASSV